MFWKLRYEIRLSCRHGVPYGRQAGREMAPSKANGPHAAGFILLLAAAFAPAVACAQQAVPRATAPRSAVADSKKSAPVPGGLPLKPVEVTHRLWNCTSVLLFAAVGVSRGLDYSSTLNLRRRGLNEILLTNSIVDNHALFAAIEVASTAASIGVSYLFYRTGHHKLERWTSIVHFSVAATGAARNYALEAPEPAP